MKCPYCGDKDNRVIDSRLARDEEEIRRRRECGECGNRFTTRERVEETLPKLIKRDERREEYDREKLERSIQMACSKRPVSEEAIQRLTDRIERRLQEGADAEVPTSVIGDRVLDELLDLDELAAARFASVFRRFEGAEDYLAFFQAALERRHAQRRDS